jgi:hypothetical protein
MMALVYHQGDERPAWVATVSTNGAVDDMTSGYTFSVRVQQGSDTPVLTKSTNITGAADGVVTVAWAEDDLDIPPGAYKVLLTATRTSDSLEWTVQDTIIILGS